MPFPNVVNSLQAPAVQGDFASTNPFASVLAGPGALVAPAGGLVVGNFAWVGPAGQVSQSYVSGYQIGFLGRNEQALITQFLGEETLVVPAGFMVTLFNEGDFWAKFANGATPGNSVFADPNTGAPYAGASAPTLGTGTASIGGNASSATISVAAGTLLVVTTMTGGIFSVGDVLTDVTNGYIPAGTTILAQITGTAGGVGHYTMSQAATGSTTAGNVTSASAVMDLTAVSAGAFVVGDAISGATDPAVIVDQLQAFSGVADITGSSSLVLTVTSVTPGSRPLYVGDAISGLGIYPGSTIATQTSGTPGGIGAYTMSHDGTGTYTGSAVVTSDSVQGGVGYYGISVPQLFASGAVTVPGTAQATGFKVRGAYTAGANELAKISTN